MSHGAKFVYLCLRQRLESLPALEPPEYCSVGDPRPFFVSRFRITVPICAQQVRIGIEVRAFLPARPWPSLRRGNGVWIAVTYPPHQVSGTKPVGVMGSVATLD